MKIQIASNVIHKIIKAINAIQKNKKGFAMQDELVQDELVPAEIIKTETELQDKLCKMADEVYDGFGNEFTMNLAEGIRSFSNVDYIPFEINFLNYDGALLMVKEINITTPIKRYLFERYLEIGSQIESYLRKKKIKNIVAGL